MEPSPDTLHITFAKTQAPEPLESDETRRTRSRNTGRRPALAHRRIFELHRQGGALEGLAHRACGGSDARRRWVGHRARSRARRSGYLAPGAHCPRRRAALVLEQDACGAVLPLVESALQPRVEYPSEAISPVRRQASGRAVQVLHARRPVDRGAERAGHPGRIERAEGPRGGGRARRRDARGRAPLTGGALGGRVRGDRATVAHRQALEAGARERAERLGRTRSGVARVVRPPGQRVLRPRHAARPRRPRDAARGQRARKTIARVAFDRRIGGGRHPRRASWRSGRRRRLPRPRPSASRAGDETPMANPRPRRSDLLTPEGYAPGSRRPPSTRSPSWASRSSSPTARRRSGASGR
jgi:hypothetical protein